MRLFTPLKYRALRYLGVVSPSASYPLPPRWALSPLGRHRFYDATACELACCKPKPVADPLCTPDCTEDCCGPLVVSAGSLPILRSPSRCAGPCGFCAGAMDPSDQDGVNGRERGAQR